MAVFVVTYNQAGNLINLERLEDEEAFQKVRTISKTGDEFVQTQTDPRNIGNRTLHFEFQQVTEDINNSPALTEEQRVRLRQIYNTFHPGDRFAYTVSVAQVTKNVQKTLPPIVIIFKDP